MQKEALKANKHVFIEKPVTHTVDEVKKLITLAQITIKSTSGSRREI